MNKPWLLVFIVLLELCLLVFIVLLGSCGKKPQPKQDFFVFKVVGIESSESINTDDPQDFDDEEAEF